MSDEDDFAPMVLASFRLPASLIVEIDALAERDYKRRADIVREALITYVNNRTKPVQRDEAEHALEVLTRLVRDVARPTAGPGT